MATLTVNVTSPASLSISGNTQKSATISWTCPTVPSGATISSCTLTGKATASMSKGSATIKVNGTTVSSGSNFTINLGTGNTTSSVTATAQGGNKNASGTVTFSNLVYTVNYSMPLPKYTVTFVDWDGTVLKSQEVEEGRSATAPSNPTRNGYTFTGWDKTFTNITSNLTVTAQYYAMAVLKVKDVNNWIDAIKIYKRINGNWVEQANTSWDSLFDVNAKYNRVKMDYFAILYSDGLLVIKDNNILDSTHGEVVEIYDMNVCDKFLNYTSVPWTNYRSNITGVYIDSVSPTDTQRWFYEFNYLTDFDCNYFDTSNVTDMSDMFRGCSTLTSLDLSSFDTSNVTSMDYMFYSCNALTSLDLSNFDTSKVTRMSQMFYSCNALTSLDLSNFDTSKVTRMSGMFTTCRKLKNLDLSSFDTSNITDMSGMFDDCETLTSLDLSNFDTSKVTNATNMFNGCTNSKLKIYVKDETTANWVKATSNFPSTATVIVGSPS